MSFHVWKEEQLQSKIFRRYRLGITEYIDSMKLFSSTLGLVSSSKHHVLERDDRGGEHITGYLLKRSHHQKPFSSVSVEYVLI